MNINLTKTPVNGFIRDANVIYTTNDQGLIDKALVFRSINVAKAYNRTKLGGHAKKAEKLTSVKRVEGMLTEDMTNWSLNS